MMKMLRRFWINWDYEVMLLGMLVSIIMVGWAFNLACSIDDPRDDLKEPVVGLEGVGGVQKCRQYPYLPCGWVYQCGDVEICLPWPDRSEIPKLKETAESLYGHCSLSLDPRFSGTPLCIYQCPSATGCNAHMGCFCLDPGP